MAYPYHSMSDLRQAYRRWCTGEGIKDIVRWNVHRTSKMKVEELRKFMQSKDPCGKYEYETAEELWKAVKDHERIRKKEESHGVERWEDSGYNEPSPQRSYEEYRTQWNTVVRGAHACLFVNVFNQTAYDNYVAQFAMLEGFTDVVEAEKALTLAVEELSNGKT